MPYFRRYPYLDDEEREIIESLNRGEWSPVSDEEYAQKMTELINAARGYFGLPPEENPQIPPHRRPLSLAELTAQLPADTQVAMPYLDDEEREIFAAYRRGETVSVSEERLCEVVCLVLTVIAESAPIPAASAPSLTANPSAPASSSSKSPRS